MAKHILFVEDDPVLSDILKQYMTGKGFEFTIANRGEKAIEFLKTSVPDIILLDLLLPEMDGFTILKAIRENPKSAGVQVVILSNLWSEDVVKRAKDMGVTEFIVKASTSPSQIEEKVNELLK